MCQRNEVIKVEYPKSQKDEVMKADFTINSLICFILILIVFTTTT